MCNTVSIITYLVLVDSKAKLQNVMPMSLTSTAAIIEATDHVFVIHVLPQTMDSGSLTPFTSSQVSNSEGENFVNMLKTSGRLRVIAVINS